MSEANEHEFIDELVAKRLRQRAEELDASALIDRIRARSGSEARSEPPRPAGRSLVAAGKQGIRLNARVRWATAAAAIAAGLLLAFMGGRYFQPASASAADVLRDVQAKCLGVDRCYQVQFTPDPHNWKPKKNQPEGPMVSTLWTRGDRFWSDSWNPPQMTLGQQGDGTLWIAPTRQKGIRFGKDPDKVPPVVRSICALNSMHVPRLLDEVLADFDLHQTTSSDGRRILISAKLKPGRTHQLLSDALLEIDTEREVLTRVVLWVTRDGKPLGTVTCTLVDMTPQDDTEYLLKTHLDEDAKVETHHFK